MDPHRGAFVYVGSRGDATLLLYRRLCTRYMAVAYRRRRAWCMLVAFSDLLDVVPVRSMPLGGLSLTLEATVPATVEAWLAEAHEALLCEEGAR